MSNIAKLKKKAAEFENRKNFENALEIYEQVLTTKHAGDEDRDVALYNRVGDLHYRIGNTEQALSYYEQAADLYADGGFFNNAIALCNKILRYAPGRTIVYYKLGIISAKKGFNSDAKQNFLEYADRMQRIGKMDEAFRALKEFADLCPGQDDVRLMLAEQLTRANRKPEALEQLEVLYDTLLVEGRSAEATATLERMKSLDPAFKPRRSITPRKRQKEGLVFLDLDFDDAVPVHRGPVIVDAEEEEDEEQETKMEGHEENEAPEPGPGIPHGFVVGPRIPAPEGLEPTSLAEPEVKEEPVAEEASAPVGELTFITPPEEVADAEPAPEFIHFEVPLIEPVTPQPALGNGSHSNGNHAAGGTPDDEFIDLGEWLEQNRTPSSTRMVTHDEEPENNEQKDFGEMLDKFKSGISRNVEDEDFGSHYDLGIAFREMGLLDEAIGSFQKAARGSAQRVRALEAIGQCFMDKGEAGVALTVLERLLHEPGMSDGQLVGVLYLLGRAAESLGSHTQAAGYFQRVQAVHIGFRDTSSRLSALA